MADPARTLADLIATALPPIRRGEVRLAVAALFARIESLEQTCSELAAGAVELERRVGEMERDDG
jgi:hypothetical protein